MRTLATLLLIITLSGCATFKSGVALQPVDCSNYTPGECQWLQREAYERYQYERRQEYNDRVMLFNMTRPIFFNGFTPLYYYNVIGY